MPHDDTQQNFYYINRRVGSTNYKVKVYFSSTENETMEEKILRMVKNDAMEIEIYLKFIGKFEIPIPEPTPEELAAEEAARKRRATQRAK